MDARFRSNLDMIGRNEPITRKAKFWQSYVRALKGKKETLSTNLIFSSFAYYFKYLVFFCLIMQVPTISELRNIRTDHAVFSALTILNCIPPHPLGHLESRFLKILFMRLIVSTPLDTGMYCIMSIKTFLLYHID